jgi:prophage tail gpP-like protein
MSANDWFLCGSILMASVILSATVEQAASKICERLGHIAQQLDGMRRNDGRDFL